MNSRMNLPHNISQIPDKYVLSGTKELYSNEYDDITFFQVPLPDILYENKKYQIEKVLYGVRQSAEKDFFYPYITSNEQLAYYLFGHCPHDLKIVFFQEFYKGYESFTQTINENIAPFPITNFNIVFSIKNLMARIESLNIDMPDVYYNESYYDGIDELNEECYKYILKNEKQFLQFAFNDGLFYTCAECVADKFELFLKEDSEFVLSKIRIKDDDLTLKSILPLVSEVEYDGMIKMLIKRGVINENGFVA